ncbi:DgyrCDS4504 [Dimorphilus gyrociliatus]|uniref:Centrosomal protein of 104 kDa n=1 Tax=Dimorphilus gyrociliatus TaxID=2664684 RepID=A0A7I8VH87_9ANNE|nr:DgyrCDS4504 [Dimorphilus gyrociliatus]
MPPSKLTFQVAHASGQDENFRVTELNDHRPTTQGWLSSRFCLYPQDIVIQLEQKSRLRKVQILSHQHMIASKIEIYVGDVPDGLSNNLQHARYTRLGYVTLSDNEKTNYKARELKSVHVDATGVFVKFVIHKNYINKFNLYNQVGLIALNIIGSKIDDPLEPNFNDPRASVDPAAAGVYNRPDYISPLEDLAFDMYQDPEIAQIIRKLEVKKQAAVLNERYEPANKLKNVIAELQKVGEKLGKYQVEKRAAVECEDYEKAAQKKAQMDEYRNNIYGELQLHQLLRIDDEPIRDISSAEPPPPAPPPRLAELPNSPAPPQLPPDTAKSPLPGLTPYDDRPLPAIAKAQQQEETPREDEALDAPLSNEVEPLSEKDAREASLAIDVFGETLVAKCYSKNFSLRESAIEEIIRELSSPSDARNSMRAAVLLSKKLLRETVYSVYKAAIELCRAIFTTLSDKVGVKSETQYAADRLIPIILLRTGESSQRLRDMSKMFTLESARLPNIQPLNVVPNECLKPLKTGVATRLALSRTEIVDSLVDDLGVPSSGMDLGSVMGFENSALQHTAGNVRLQAEKTIVKLYENHKEAVRTYLPPDDDKTRRNVLYRQLFETFDKIEGKPSKAELKKLEADKKRAKKEEVAALQKQLDEIKELNAAQESALRQPQPKKHVAGKENKKSDDKEEKEKENDKACIFCGEMDEDFIDDAKMNVHYWKSCPMLKRCSFCKQVVEISSFNDHLINECGEGKKVTAKCPRCGESINKEELEGHLAAKACLQAKDGEEVCPLCHQIVVGGENGWKSHLMGENGCKNNARRLQQGKESQSRPNKKRTPRR